MNENGNCLAKQAYSAYGAVTDFKNYQGLPMPKWEDLPEKIRQAWVAASDYCYIKGYKDGHEEGMRDATTRKCTPEGEPEDNQHRLAREAGEVLGCLKRAGVAILCCFGFYKPGERAKFDTLVSVHNDHQALDLLREITKCWSDANHEDASGENSCGKDDR